MYTRRAAVQAVDCLTEDNKYVFTDLQSLLAAEDKKYVCTEGGCILQVLLKLGQLRTETVYTVESWGRESQVKAGRVVEFSVHTLGGRPCRQLSV